MRLSVSWWSGIITCVAIAGSAVMLPAQPSSEQKAEQGADKRRPTNFDERPDLVEQGLHHLNIICSRCHGLNGKGAKGPDLTSGRFRRAKTDDDLMANGNLVFGGSKQGNFYALHAETGKELWRLDIGGNVHAAPVTYLANGQQLVSIAAGSALFTFGL